MLFISRMLPRSVPYIGKSWTLLQFSFAYCIIFDPSIYKLAHGINEKDEVLWSFVGVREKIEGNREEK